MSRSLQGADLWIAPKKKIKNWVDTAPDITAKGLAGQWGQEGMVKFLMTGVDPNGEKPGLPMPIFHLQERDARAIALYLKSRPRGKGKDQPKAQAEKTR